MRALHLSFLAAFLLAACGEDQRAADAAAVSASGAAASDAAALEFPPLSPDVEVSLATPLVPGIPGSPGHLIKSSRNPNGDSELAYLMRLFVDDLREARAKVDAGEALPRLYDRHRRMRAAWPSKPEQRDEHFDGMAQSYLAAVRAFEADWSPPRFNAIIDACIACHSGSCGGPIEFIDSLKWQ